MADFRGDAQELFAEKIKMMISVMMLHPTENEPALRIIFEKIIPIRKLIVRDMIMLELYLQMLSYPDEGDGSRQQFNAYLNEFTMRSDVMSFCHANVAKLGVFQRDLLVSSLLTKRMALIKVLHL